MRYLITLLIVGIMGSCRVVESLKTKDYHPPIFISWDKFLASFVGKDFEAAQKEFGYKYVARDLPSGKKAYTWENIRQSGWIYGNQSMVGGSSNTFTCQWAFVADSDGIIQEQWSDGNGCPRSVQIQ